MKKQPEITEKTRQILVDTFCSFYEQRPIERITVKEITASAGYNRGTFYQYFPDVYAVREYVEADLITEIKASWENHGNSILSPQMDELILLYERKEIYLRAVLSDYGCVHFSNSLKAALPIEGIKSAMKQNELLPYLIEFHLSTSQSLFRAWLKTGKVLPATELIKLIHELYTSGISAFSFKMPGNLYTN